MAGEYGMKTNFDYLFGTDSKGNTEIERAKTSKQVFVRGQKALALINAGSTGRILTAYEALKAYNIAKIQEVMDYGSAILSTSGNEPSSTLKTRRQDLGLSIKSVAAKVGLSVKEIEKLEGNKEISAIRNIEKVAAVLGLDERMVSAVPGAGGDSALAVRLKGFSGAKADRFSENAVMTFSEAAWVITTQYRLQQMFDDVAGKSLVDYDDDYGDEITPAWKKGFQLARLAREKLSVGPVEPIESMRTICERIKVPLIFAMLPKNIAGATIEAGGQRGILINSEITNVWVQRVTIAHELGHLLWDPIRRLNEIKVDKNESIGIRFDSTADHVEARANAFAVGFIAPEYAVMCEFNDADGDWSTAIYKIMDKFGLSLSAAKAHILNVIGEHGNINDKFQNISITPSDEWNGRERLTVDFYPLNKEKTPMRKGEFAGLVVRAEMEGLISTDTAIEYLQTTEGEYKSHRDTIYNIYYGARG
jgi:Zn-dependent peptidase ImmA (M78 family)